MYYKLSEVRVNLAKHRVLARIAPNNIRPITYYGSEYKGFEGDWSIERSLRNLGVDILNGDVHPNPKCKVYVDGFYFLMKAVTDAMQEIRNEAKVTSWERDHKSCLKREQKLYDFLAREFFTPILSLKRSLGPEFTEELKEKVRAFDAESADLYRRAAVL